MGSTRHVLASRAHKLENILTRSEEIYLKLLEDSKDGVYDIKGDEFIYVHTRDCLHDIPQ